MENLISGVPTDLEIYYDGSYVRKLGVTKDLFRYHDKFYSVNSITGEVREFINDDDDKDGLLFFYSVL